jgi:shikimate kinase
MDNLKLKQPLFLCGMMGSGKSTIGKALANKAAAPFKDLDSMIVDEAGMSIPKIFDQKGESWFRKLEREILIRESQTFKGVMALGGGSLQNQHLVDHLKIYGWLIFLRVPKSVILDRVAGDPNRPKLAMSKESTEDLTRKISTLMEQRLPFYSQAHITIDAGTESPDGIAENILKKIKIYDGISGR